MASNQPPHQPSHPSNPALPAHQTAHIPNIISNDYEYPDNLDILPMPLRADDSSVDGQEDDQTNSAEYDLLLQEATESDLRETELTGRLQYLRA